MHDASQAHVSPNRTLRVSEDLIGVPLATGEHELALLQIRDMVVQRQADAVPAGDILATRAGDTAGVRFVQRFVEATPAATAAMGMSAGSGMPPPGTQEEAWQPLRGFD